MRYIYSFLDTLYYQFYQLYHFIPNNDIHFKVLAIIGCSFGFILQFSLNFLLSKFICYAEIMLFYYLVVMAFSFFSVYKYYNKSRVKRILKLKPYFFKNKKLSHFLTVLYFLSCFIIYLFAAYIAKENFNSCV